MFLLALWITSIVCDLSKYFPPAADNRTAFSVLFHCFVKSALTQNGFGYFWGL